MNLFVRSIVFICLAVTSGCAAAVKHNAIPEDVVSKAVVKGYPPEIRYWGDEALQKIDDVVAKRIKQYKEANKDYYEKNGEYPVMDYLALSGGGNDGAFGAGLLKGWTENGNRPQFTVVTGTSTGALIAPLAFLGPEYDAELEKVYTTIKSENIFESSVLTVVDGLTGGLAIADTAPLEENIRQVITQDIFNKIAAEHRKGRRLLIGTTNIEAQRSVIWDMGAIANSGRPDALVLFRKIMLASSAIPGAFKPVFIDVVVDGKQYNEIHVDGGVTSQVFLYPLETTKRERELYDHSGIKRRMFVVRNTKITPQYEQLDPGVLSLTQRAVQTLIKSHGVGDIFRLYVGAERDGIDYNFIHVPAEFDVKSEDIFDPVYMKAIFQEGYEAGKEVNWLKKPPSVEYIRVEEKKDKANLK